MVKKKPQKPTAGDRAADRALRRLRLRMRTKLILFAILTVALAVTLIFSNQINHAMGVDARLKDKVDTPDSELNVVKDGDLKVHFVDVGQGDCTIIQFPDNKNMIVDGGEKDQRETVLNYIENNVKNKKGETIEYFDYCVLTHTDSDHCGSLDDVLNAYPAKVVYRPNVVGNAKNYVDPVIALTRDSAAEANVKLWYGTETNPVSIVDTVQKKSTAAYRDFLEAAYDSDSKEKLPAGTETKVIVSDGRRDSARPYGKHTQDIFGAGYNLKFYAPLSAKYNDWNNYSNIMTLKYNNRTLMLTGDAEKEAEAEFVSAYVETFAAADLKVDILKLGHHGSRTSSSEAFLDAVMRKDPDGKLSGDYFVISCGLNNSYGHPHKETVTRLTDKFGVPAENLLRTDSNGTVMLSIDRSGTTIGDIAVAPSYTATPTDSPLEWWHIAALVEGIGFITVFLIVGTKKAKDAPRRKNKGSRAA